MKRLTSKGFRLGKDNSDLLPSYESIYHRLFAIEGILGDEYDLDRLRELAQADREGRCVVLACPGCGESRIKICYVFCNNFGMCKTCDWTGPVRNTDYEARLAWNARAPILSAEELEMLEGME